MKLVLIHGWGFHGGIWRDLAGSLADHELVMIDLGFVRGGPKGASAMPADAVYIGAFLRRPVGAETRAQANAGSGQHRRLRLLSQTRAGRRPGDHGLGHAARPRSADAGLLAQMRRRRRRAGGRDRCGALRAGLGWLGKWDVEEERRSLRAPILALAARDDPIVREQMTEAIWGDGSAQLHWLDEGGHILPVTKAAWCTERIRDFIDELD